MGREPDEEGYHYRFWIRRKLARKAGDAGFRIEERNSFGYYPLMNRVLLRRIRGLEKVRVRVSNAFEPLFAEHFCWRLVKAR